MSNIHVALFSNCYSLPPHVIRTHWHCIRHFVLYFYAGESHTGILAHDWPFASYCLQLISLWFNRNIITQSSNRSLFESGNKASSTCLVAEVLSQDDGKFRQVYLTLAVIKWNVCNHCVAVMITTNTIDLSCWCGSRLSVFPHPLFMNACFFIFYSEVNSRNWLLLLLTWLGLLDCGHWAEVTDVWLQYSWKANTDWGNRMSYALDYFTTHRHLHHWWAPLIIYF